MCVCLYVYVCVCVCVCARARASVRAARVQVCMHICFYLLSAAACDPSRLPAYEQHLAAGACLDMCIGQVCVRPSTQAACQVQLSLGSTGRTPHPTPPPQTRDPHPHSGHGDGAARPTRSPLAQTYYIGVERGFREQEPRRPRSFTYFHVYVLCLAMCLCRNTRFHI